MEATEFQATEVRLSEDKSVVELDAVAEDGRKIRALVTSEYVIDLALGRTGGQTGVRDG